MSKTKVGTQAWYWGPQKGRWSTWVSGEGSRAICICDAGSEPPSTDVRATGAGGSCEDQWGLSFFFTGLGRTETTYSKSSRLAVGRGPQCRPLGTWSPYTSPGSCPSPTAETQLCPTPEVGRVGWRWRDIPVVRSWVRGWGSVLRWARLDGDIFNNFSRPRHSSLWPWCKFQD